MKNPIDRGDVTSNSKESQVRRDNHNPEHELQMIRISNKTALVLKEYGWNEGRRIEVSTCIELLKSAGCQIFDKLTAFLSEFGNLDLNFTDGAGVKLFVSFDTKWFLTLINQVIKSY